MTEALLQQAIDAIRRGDKATGQKLLAQVLRADPRSETAWLWMSQIVESDTQRLDCLRRILAINPNNATARRAIELLETRMGVSGPAPTRPAATPPPAETKPIPPPPRLAGRSAPIRARPPAAPQPAAPDDDDLASRLSAFVTHAPARPAAPSAAPPAEESQPDLEEAAPLKLPAVEEAPQAMTPAPARCERMAIQLSPRARRIIGLAAGALIAGVILVAFLSSRSNQPQPVALVSTAGRLLVTSRSNGASQISAMRSDGSDVKLLSPGEGAAWSPDGARIALAMPIDGATEIVVIGSNGEGSAQLTRTGGQNVDPAWSPDGTRILFASDREGDFDIFTMPADGSAPFNLTRFEGDDRAAAWTPDGQAIVFQSDREGQSDLYRMNADGSGLARLTADPAEDTSPRVSPDGESIAFVSTRDGDADIYVMGIDGSSPRALTSNRVEDRAPSWTPDGAILFTSFTGDGPALYVVQPDGSDLKPLALAIDGLVSAAWQPVDSEPAALPATPAITPTVAAPPSDLPSGSFVFASNRDGNFELYSVRTDGSNLTQLTSTPADERHPSVSPVSAQQIAFDAPVSNTQQIFVLDSVSVITLTQSPLPARRPAWSPDGTRLAYQIDAESGPDLAIASASGSGILRLTERPGFDGCFSWRPDGQRLAYTSDAGGSLDVFVIGADGSNAERLTRHAAGDFCPAWSPDAQRIAFLSDRSGQGVYLMSADGSNLRLLAALSTQSASQPAWSPDGKFLLVSSNQDGDSDVYLIALDSGAVWNLTLDSDADEVDPVWVP